MIGWWCADISFWGAAGLLAVLGVAQVFAARRQARHAALSGARRGAPLRTT